MYDTIFGKYVKLDSLTFMSFSNTLIYLTDIYKKEVFKGFHY